MQEQLHLQKELREKQEKYSYYLIALCVTCIGFSILQTKELKLDYIHIPIGLAVLFWSVSIYSGFQYIGILTASIHRTILAIDVMQGKDDITGSHPEKIAIGLEVYSKGNKKIVKKSIFFYGLQNWTFYIGVVLFLIWHLIRMYQN